MTDILLSHGHFIAEDEKEQQIMRPYPLLGLLYLSAYLKRAGFIPEVLDSTFANRTDFVRRLAAGEPGILGLYTTHMTRPSVVPLIREAKRLGWIVVLGGPDAANYPDEYLGAGADVVVLGEGEATLTDLLSAVRDAGVHRLHDVHGIAFRGEDGHVVRTPDRPPLPIDSIPWPDREAVDLTEYLDAWSEHHGTTSLNFVTQRGCPYHCRWCSKAVFGKSYRRRDPADCAAEVASIVETYGPDQLWIADDVFTLDHDWLIRYTAECRNRCLRVPFETISRADRLMDEDVLRLLAGLGCRKLWIGSESGSDRMLRAMERGVTREQIQWATREAQRQGIEVGLFVMWGYEGETFDDIEATVEHLRDTQPDVFFTTIVHPIKGTPYYGEVEDKLVAPPEWAASTDKDYRVRDQRGKDYYRHADRWIRAAVEVERLAESDPTKSAAREADAREARARLLELSR